MEDDDPQLKGSKTHANLKAAFAGESQANRRYRYFRDLPVTALASRRPWATGSRDSNGDRAGCIDEVEDRELRLGLCPGPMAIEETRCGYAAPWPSRSRAGSNASSTMARYKKVAHVGTWVMSAPHRPKERTDVN
jgi:hypothetical protein